MCQALGVKNPDQRLWTAAALSALCHCFRPDGEVCKAAGQACPTREPSKGNETLGNPGGRQMFSIFNVWTWWSRGGKLRGGNTKSDGGGGVRTGRRKENRELIE